MSMGKHVPIKSSESFHRISFEDDGQNCLNLMKLISCIVATMRPWLTHFVKVWTRILKRRNLSLLITLLWSAAHGNIYNFLISHPLIKRSNSYLLTINQGKLHSSKIVAEMSQKKKERIVKLRTGDLVIHLAKFVQGQSLKSMSY